MSDWELIVADLETLHHAVSEIGDWDKDLIEEFIRVGGYGLARDGIAYAYLNSGKAMPANLFQILEKLSIDMGVDDDEAYAGMVQLRAETKGRLAELR